MVGEVGKTGVVAVRSVVGDSRLEGDHVTIPLLQMVEIGARVNKRNKGSAIKNLVPLMEFGDLGVIGEIVLNGVEEENRQEAKPVTTHHHKIKEKTVWENQRRRENAKQTLVLLMERGVTGRSGALAPQPVAQDRRKEEGPAPTLLHSMKEISALVRSWRKMSAISGSVFPKC